MAPVWRTVRLSPAGRARGPVILARACTAVGSAKRRGIQRTLAVHWNGTSWAIQPAPVLARTAAPLLLGVSCRSAAARTAVGRRFNPIGVPRTLAERHT